MSPDRIAHAPWTETEIANLLQWQNTGYCHPYTHCWQGKGSPDNCGATLVPTRDGWLCPTHGCGFTQDWAYSDAADGSYVQMMEAIVRQMRASVESERDNGLPQNVPDTTYGGVNGE